MKHIPEADTGRYGVFLNEEWLEETPAVGSFKLRESDTLALRRMDKELSQTMLSTTHNLGQLAETARSRPELAVDQPPNMLPGEVVANVVPNIVHLHISPVPSDQGAAPPATSPAASSTVGTLFVTNYRIVFIPQPRAQDKPATPCSTAGFEMPLTAVQRIDKGRGISASYGRFCCFAVKSKHFHDMRFSYLNSPDPLAPEVFPDEIVERAVFHRSVSKIFAFNADWVHSFAAKQVEEMWRKFSPVSDYTRQGMLNKNSLYCASYPQAICVPSDIQDKDLIPVFAFRSRGRIPALVWLHPETGAALLRCGQPSVGIKSARCFEDERLMGAIGAKNPQCRSVFILDARPKLAAKANQLLKGRGFEFSRFYTNTSISFLGIDNIHKMRESEEKLRKVVLLEPESMIAAKLPASRWLGFIQLLLNSAFEIVVRLRKAMTCLAHCSDGWDRTPQLTSLAMLILDPWYRTIDGFITLIEKEWISFGHQFDKRCAHLVSAEGSSEQSPIFLQFIDCAWQIMNHIPAAFEFNQQLLIDILDELYACRFGTFLFNSESERAMYQTHAKTVPLWLHLLSHRAMYANPSFVPATALFATAQGIRAINVVLWEAYYFRWRRLHSHDMGESTTGPAGFFPAGL
jgi:myotubularin-related protein 1/2